MIIIVDQRKQQQHLLRLRRFGCGRYAGRDAPYCCDFGAGNSGVVVVVAFPFTVGFMVVGFEFGYTLSAFIFAKREWRWISEGDSEREI